MGTAITKVQMTRDKSSVNRMDMQQHEIGPGQIQVIGTKYVCQHTEVTKKTNILDIR